MPIKILTRSFERNDPRIKPSQLVGQLSTPCSPAANVVLLESHAYAFLEPTSPKEAILCQPDAGSHVLVMHCVATRRTSVSFADWGFPYNPAYAGQLEWLTAGGGGSVEVLVFRPARFRAPYSRDELISALTNATAPSAIQLAVTFTSFDPAADDVIEVARGVPICTSWSMPPEMILNRHALEDPSTIEWASAPVLCAVNHLTSVISEGKAAPLWPRYDGQRDAARLPILSDAARSRVQAARNAHSQGGTRQDNLLAIESHFFDAIRRFEAKKLCGGCKEETYCSVEHQREDWPRHKGWCKQNRKSPASRE